MTHNDNVPDIYKDLKPPHPVAFLAELQHRDGVACIAEIFARDFDTWQITLPDDHVINRERGVIQQAGWTIRYRFDRDAHGEFLDYYAQHRMTNARHERIYTNGDIQSLPTQQEFMVFPANATPEQTQRIQDDYYAYNQAVGAMLREKGFY